MNIKRRLEKLEAQHADPDGGPVLWREWWDMHTGAIPLIADRYEPNWRALLASIERDNDAALADHWRAHYAALRGETL